MADTPNVGEVMAFLDDFAKSINMTLPGQQQSLGRDIGLCVARGPDVGALGGIAGRCANGVAPDGTPWKPNNPTYSKRKDAKYGWDEINRRTGQMLSQESLAANIEVSADQVTLRYGTGQPPSTSVAPTGYLSASDKKTSDTVKAAMAHENGRAFFGINQEDAENVAKIAVASVSDLVKATNAKNGY